MKTKCHWFFWEICYEIFSQKFKIGQLWDDISPLTINKCFFCDSPRKREFSDLFKTPQTFYNPITTPSCQAVRSSEILYFHTFFTFPENFWTSDSWQTLYNYWINKSLECFEKIRKFPLSWAITKKTWVYRYGRYIVPKLAYFSLL